MHLQKMKKEIYCLVCRDYTKNNNPKIFRNGQSNCAIAVIKSLDLLKNNKQWEY